jgi:hypothetical protein
MTAARKAQISHPKDLAKDADALARDSDLLHAFLRRYFAANPSLSDEQRASIHMSLDEQAFAEDLVFAMIANATAAIRRADLKHLIET